MNGSLFLPLHLSVVFSFDSSKHSEVSWSIIILSVGISDPTIYPAVESNLILCLQYYDEISNALLSACFISLYYSLII